MKRAKENQPEVLKLLTRHAILVLFFVMPLMLDCQVIFGQVIVGEITRTDLKPRTLAVYETGNKLLVGDQETGNLLIYDGASLTLLAEIPVERGAAGSRMVVHEQSGKLYILPAFLGFGNSITVVDANANQFIRSVNVDDGQFLTIDQGLGKVYTFNRFASSLHVIDVLTDSLNSVSLSSTGITPTGMGVNPVTHEVFVGYLHGESLDIVDGNTLAQTTVPGINGRDMVINWMENKVYGEEAGFSGFWVYNRDAGTLIVRSTLNDAGPEVFNPTGNRMYGNSEINQKATIIEGVSDEFIDLPMKGPTAVGIRYSTNHGYYAGVDFLGVLDDSTQTLAQIPIDHQTPGGLLFQQVAINQTTGRVFVVNDADNFNVIKVLQDTEMLARPPVFIGGKGETVKVLDPHSKMLVDSWTSNPFVPIPSHTNHSLAIRPGGGRIYVPAINELRIYAGSGDFAWLLSFATGGQKPISPVFTPDGRRLYVTNSASGSVGVIETEGHTVLQTITVGSTPWGAAITPDGEKVYVTNLGNNSSSVIHTASNTITKTITVGTAPWGVAVNPGGSRVYVANSGSGTVSVIDARSENVIATVGVGATPHWLTVTPDGLQVYVTNSGDGTVSVIDAETNRIIRTLPVGEKPEGIGVLPDGREVYVINAGVSSPSTITVINTSDFSDTTIAFPASPNQLLGLAIADPTARFAGRVIASGTSIKGAVIRVRQDGMEKGRATTIANGDYSVFNLNAGIYDIEVNASGYPTQTRMNQAVRMGRTTILNIDLLSTGVEEDEGMITEFRLYQNYPNPFNPSTTIRYALHRAGFVQIRIYNELGQFVRTLVNEEKLAGEFSTNWDGRDYHGRVLPSGIYFYEIHSDQNFLNTGQLMMVKLK
jgi:YVTN family beta-propeller protein